MKNHNGILPQILLLLAAAFWGASFIFTKGLFLTEAEITPSIILVGRMLIATVVTMPVLLVTGRLERIKKGHLKYFLLLALAEPFLYSICETSGVKFVSGSLASIIIATIPLFVPFGMALFYGEKLHLRVFVGIVLSLCGIALMSFGDDVDLTASWQGLALLAAAVVIAVAYTIILVKVVGQYKPFTVTAYQNLFAFVYFVPLMLVLDAPHLGALSYSPRMFLYLAFLGIFCSTVAYAFYNYGISRLGATKGSLYSNTIPVFSLIAALIMGQESVGIAKLAGVVIVLVGLTLAQRNKHKMETSKQ